MRSYQVMLDGQRMACCESTGKGQTILFIHGNSLSGLCFGHQLESPLGRQYRCIALDLPGHGSSAPASNPDAGYTLPGYADILIRFVQSIAADNLLIVGWSLGGHILLEAANRLQTAKGFMIFGTPPVGNPMAADAFISNPLFPLLFKSELCPEDAAALAAAFVKPGAQPPALFADELLRTDNRARETLGRELLKAHYTDEVTVAANLNKPLALVHGEADALVNLAYIKDLNIPSLWREEVQVIADAGHAPHWEQPEQFNRLLAEFAATIFTD